MTNKNSFALTYGQLKEQVAQIQTARGVSAQQIRNFASAINGWLRRLGISDAATIGAELGPDFPNQFQMHQDYLLERVSARTMRDQSENLLTWRKHFEERRCIDTLPPSFHAAFYALVIARGISQSALARASGVAKMTINAWLTQGITPTGYSAPSISRIEQALGVPDGTLLNRMPGRKYSRYDKQRKMACPPLRTKWGERIAAQRKAIGVYAMRLDGQLQEQWFDLIDFKTDTYREGATYRNTWRVKALTDTGCRLTKEMMTRHNMACASANPVWSGVSCYLGFLCMAAPGKGIERKDAQTIAWLVHLPYLMDYVRWLTTLAEGKVHHGITCFLKSVKSLIRPTSGFLWSRTDLAATLPNPAMVLGADFPALTPEQQANRWQQHCASVHAKCIERLRTMEGNHQKVSKARDPREPIAQILASPSPLKELLRLIRSVELNPPPMSHGRTYVVWLRDVLLLKMLVSNPLRVSQFAIMRYRPDNRGNLYQATDGHWRLRFVASDFKNQKGAAFEDYDVAVEPSVVPWITRYLAEARPHGVRADSCYYLFLPFVFNSNGKQSEKKGGMWPANSIGQRVTLLTHKYLPDTPGFAPHAFRHIIATDHLKRHPGDYPTVAQLLHDKLQTVLSEYSHVSVEQGLQVLHQGIQHLSAEFA